MAASLPQTASARGASGPARRGFYPSLALAISATAFAGFFFTYFGPIAAGSYPAVSPTVHVHGWSFFLWYLLLPLQALLIGGRRIRLHMLLGKASMALVAVMVVSGLVVLSVSMERALAGAQDDFSFFLRKNGGLVFLNLLLFAGFYLAAVSAALRGKLAAHRRLVVLASASGLGAAIFRLAFPLFGTAEWAGQPLWAPATALFILVGMAHDKATLGGVHAVYWKGLAWIAALHLLLWPFPGSPIVPLANAAFASLADGVRFLYP